MKLTLKSIVLIVFAIALSACGDMAAILPALAPPPATPLPAAPLPPAQTTISIEATADLNPDASGRPSPVVLRIYELKSLNTFNSSDFFSLYEQDENVLGADLTGRQALTISPGQNQRLARTLNAETRHIGLLAGYRDLDRAIWRAAVDIPAQQAAKLHIQLGRTRISAQTAAY